MRRREFITLLGGASVVWPLAARAQQPSAGIRRIGVLYPSAQDASWAENVEGLRRGLTELGYVEGRNFILELRWADGQMDRLPELARQLVEAKVDLMVVASGVAARAAANATSSVPIVQASGADPSRSGLANSLSKPGTNVTGITNQSEDLSAKLLELLLMIIPKAPDIGVLYVPDAPATVAQLRGVEQAARAMSVTITGVEVAEFLALDGAFAQLARAKVAGLIVLSAALFSAHSRPIVELARTWRLPAIYPYRNFVFDGGLMAYGTNSVEQWRQSARIVDRILRGARPADLPIQQPTRFGLLINLKTAKALGLEVPPTLLARADEVIE